MFGLLDVTGFAGLSRGWLKYAHGSLWLASALVVGAQGVAAAVPPQSPAERGDEIVEEDIVVRASYLADEKFSATKTRTPLVDVPQSLSLVSAAQIADQFFVDVSDVSRYTPGLSIGQGEGHRDQITIRGQNTTADFFIDGLRDDVQYFRPLYNLEQVEILRGSNALMFGRGGGGGIINRVTKRAIVGETFGAMSGSVNSQESSLLAVDGNLSLGTDAALRLNAFYEQMDNHRDFFDGDRFAINPTLTREFGSTRLVVSYEYVDDDRVVDRGVPAVDGGPLRDFDRTYFGDPDFNRTTLAAHIARARIDHDFGGDVSFNATVQYANYDKLYRNLYPAGIDLDAGMVTLDGYIDTTDRENLIGQANLVLNTDLAGMKHTLLFGVEAGTQDTANTRRDTFFADSADDQVTFAFTDPLVIPAVSFPTLNRDRESDVRFQSVYLQDQVDLSASLKLVAGLRYDRFDIDVTDFVEVRDGAADGNDGDLGRVDEEWSPRLGLIYKPAQNISVYASYSNSFLPRSGDQFLTLSLSSETLKPEEFENLELGLKWDLSNRLALTAAVFRLDRDSGTAVDPTDPDNTITIGSRTKGFEAQLSGALSPRWNINAGYSYLDANERGRVVNGAVANRDLSQVPQHMFSVWNRYDVTERLGFGLGVVHQAEQFASLSNAVELPDYTRVDAAVYFAVSPTVQVQLNVENLFDVDYFPAAHNDNNISTGEPLEARLTFSAHF